MALNRLLNRKSFVNTVGVAGLGLGLMSGTIGAAPSAMAQEEDATPARAATQDVDDPFAKRADLYADFTAALAEELGLASPDEADAAIRIAMMAVIDDQVAEDLLTAGQAEALKFLVATADVPLGPGMMPGGPGKFIAMHGPGGEGPMVISRGQMVIGHGGDHEGFMGQVKERREGDREGFIERIRERHASEDDAGRSSSSDRAADNDSDATDEEGEPSS
jgi:hypothetical protein